MRDANAIAFAAARGTRTTRERLSDALHDRPFAISLAAQMLVLAIAIGLGDAHFYVWPSHAPRSADAALATLWQVDAVFVSLAFAGLAVLFQLGTEQLVSGKNLRGVLFHYTRFQLTFAYCIAGLVQLGVVSLWFVSTEGVVVEFIAVAVVSVAIVSLAYWRAAEVYSSPTRARRLAAQQLEVALRKSQQRTWAVSEANHRLHDELPELFGPAPADSAGDLVERLVPSGGDGRVRDVNIEVLRDAVRRVRAATPSRAEVGGSQRSTPRQRTNHASLTMYCGIGGMVQPEEFLFTVRLPAGRSLDVTKLGAQLASAVEWASDGWH